MNISEREREILEYLCQGLAGKQIAELANTSPGTVKSILSRLRKKLNCPNSITLAVYVERNQILTKVSNNKK